MRLGLGHGLDVGYRPELFSNVPLLDTYSGAAAAYSLRKLRSGVTSVVRVRRSSDNAEADFTATEVSDGTLTTWTGANDGFVVTWYDQSGNGKNFTQATAGSQPKLVSAGSLITLNLLPAVEFDGANDYLINSDLSYWTFMHNGATNYAFITMMANKTSRGDILGNLNSALDKGISYSFPLDSLYKIRAINGNGAVSEGSVNTSGNNAFVSGSQFLATIIADPDNGTAANRSEISINQGTAIKNNVVTTAPSTSAPAQSMAIGALNGTLGANPFKGSLQELIIYNGDKSADRAAIEAAINSHYSIY